MKLKSLISEHVLGKLPSEKLMKMKWNPITGETIKEVGKGHNIGGEDEDETVDEMTPTYGKGDVIHDCPKHVKHEVTGVPGEVVGHSLNE